MTQTLVQAPMRVQMEGRVEYPEGTRVVTLVVPPGVVFDVPDGVLVESDLTV